MPSWVEVKENVALLHLESIKFGKYVATIDVEDAQRVAEYPWMMRIKEGKVSYVSSTSRKLKVMLHRFILELSSSDPLVDHIDRNPLNNRRDNLRLTTKAENAVNSAKKKGDRHTSNYKGVSFDKKRGLYRARVNDLEFGSFKLEEQAAEAYNFYSSIFYKMPLGNPVSGTGWFKDRVFKGTSVYHGVTKNKRGNWEAGIWNFTEKKVNRIGLFESEMDAAVAYNSEALIRNFRPNRLNLIDTNGKLINAPGEDIPLLNLLSQHYYCAS